MKRIALAALFALSIPAAASADSWREARPVPAPAAGPSLRDDRRDVRQLDRLMARYDEAAALRDRRAMDRLEWRLLAAIDEEIAEARGALRQYATGRDARDGYGGYGGYGRDERDGRDGYGRHGRFEDRRADQVRFELARLTSLRAEFVNLQGRFGWRAAQRKLAVVAEVARLARADLARTPYGAPVAWNGHR